MPAANGVDEERLPLSEYIQQTPVGNNIIDEAPIPNNILHITNEDYLLRHVIENQNEATLEDDLNNCTEDLRLFKYNNYQAKTILIIACIDDRVSEITLKTLFTLMKTKYDSIDYTDPDSYGWEPIHFIAYYANFKKFEAILEVLPDSINSLTYFSENALHVLLEHKGSAVPFSAILRNDRGSRSVTILGTLRDGILGCADLLIKKGIDINQTNYWNETPLSIAARKQFADVIKLFLTVHNIDIDSFKEAGLTLREYLLINHFTSLPRTYIQEDPVKIRFNFLKSGDEKQFLQFYPDSLGDHVNSTDGGQRNDDTNNNDMNESCTMLQLCLRKGFWEYLQHDSYKYKIMNNCDITNNPMLTVFKSKGLGKSIIHLLDNGANISEKTKKFKATALEYVAVRGYYPVVAILLQNPNSDITSENIFSILSMVLETDLKLKNHEFYRNCVLYLLFEKLILFSKQNKLNLRHENQQGEPNIEQYVITSNDKSNLNKILYQLNLECDDSKLNETEIIHQILYLGGNLTYKPQSTIFTSDPSEGRPNKENDDTPQKNVAVRLHESVLRKHFDSCIEGSTFRYDSVIQDETMDRNENIPVQDVNEQGTEAIEVYNEHVIIEILARDNCKRKLLTHPLLIHLMRKKWNKIYRLFYANLIFCLTFLFSVYWYMISQHYRYSIDVCNYIFYILLVLQIVKEVCQGFFLYKADYILQSSNILEVCTIVMCLFTIFIPNVVTSVFAILLVTFMCFLLVSQLPAVTEYTIIFKSVRSFIEYMLFYCPIFFAFALCFYIIFPFDNNTQNNATTLANITNNSQFAITNVTGLSWGEFGKHLYYTFVFFTGEFSDRVNEPTQHPIFGRFFMTSFIFCMTIILNNLILGLIVANMSEIQESSRIYKQVNQANFIVSIYKCLVEMQSYRFLKVIGNQSYKMDLFESNRTKVLEMINPLKFDDPNQKYLKELEKAEVVEKIMLKDIYNQIL